MTTSDEAVVAAVSATTTSTETIPLAAEARKKKKKGSDDDVVHLSNDNNNNKSPNSPLFMVTMRKETEETLTVESSQHGEEEEEEADDNNEEEEEEKEPLSLSSQQQEEDEQDEEDLLDRQHEELLLRLSSSAVGRSPRSSASEDHDENPLMLEEEEEGGDEVRSREWLSGAPFEQQQRQEEEDDEDDEEEGSSRHKVQRSLEWPPRHGHQPSTIMEDSSMSFVIDDDADDKKEVEPLLNRSFEEPHPLSSSKPTSSFSLLRPVQSSPGLLMSSFSCEQRQQQRGESGAGPATGFQTMERRREEARRADFEPMYASTRFYQRASKILLRRHCSAPNAHASWIGFWALLHVTCANYVLTPLRDAIALQVGVRYMPQLTLASTVLAVFSSVPIGWLFEAPDPGRLKVWKRMGLTRGETQGTSLALFYRCFAFILLSYAVGFSLTEQMAARTSSTSTETTSSSSSSSLASVWVGMGRALYVAFFLVCHLMKLHCLSLVWGVTTEAMEYEEVARRQAGPAFVDSSKTRLQRLALVGFGGTLGGIVGSGLASTTAHLLKLPGLLCLAACLLEISAELSIELGRIMQKHWVEQQLFQSSTDLASLDASMRRSSSLGSMKRISSGNSLNRVKSTSELSKSSSNGSTSSQTPVTDDTFRQRLMRGVTTILRSRLLMAIFTYNALYASTTVLLSFQRAELVANRKDDTTVQADTAFLANINMASSIAIFALQASGAGAYVAHMAGPRGTLALMPLIRLAGVVSLAWWHRYSYGKPPNLLTFLVVDECCKIMNLAVAKPVRESLWRGLSNEARYEAKPIVDTLANRWGGGSAAFLVSFVGRTLDLFGVEGDAEGKRNLFGFPPVLFLCIIIATWWVAVSADLGHIRKNIDLELKKRL
jgi:ATP/ADP translocase